jgi:hypothetical protein
MMQNAAVLCRQHYSSALHVLHEVILQTDLASSKKLRQQVISDVLSAAEWLRRHSLPTECGLLHNMCTPLRKALPVKACQRIEQAVAQAQIAVKRVADKDGQSAPGSTHDVLSPATTMLAKLPRETVDHILTHLSAQALAALCCTSRYETRLRLFVSAWSPHCCLLLWLKCLHMKCLHLGVCTPMERRECRAPVVSALSFCLQHRDVTLRWCRVQILCRSGSQCAPSLATSSYNTSHPRHFADSAVVPWREHTHLGIVVEDACI